MKGHMKCSRILMLLIALLLVLQPAVFAQNAKRTAKVSSFQGEVQVLRAGSEKKIKAFKNMRLSEGDTVITGKSSSAVVEIAKESKFTIAAESKVVLTELMADPSSTRTTLNLQSGGVGSQVDTKLNNDSRYQIKTPTTVMGVRGTEFYVQYEDGDTDLWVAQGTVQVDFRIVKNRLAVGFASHIGKPESVTITAPHRISFDYGATLEEIKKSLRAFDTEGLYPEFIQKAQELENRAPGTFPSATASGFVQDYLDALKDRDRQDPPPAPAKEHVVFEDPNPAYSASSGNSGGGGGSIAQTPDYSYAFGTPHQPSASSGVIPIHPGVIPIGTVLKAYVNNSVVATMTYTGTVHEFHIYTLLPALDGVDVTFTAPGMTESDEVYIDL